MKWWIGLALLGSSLGAITIDTTNEASIKAACGEVIEGMLTYYTGNKPGGTPGILVGPYYWWEAGGMMGQLINYWTLTGDTTYNQLVFDALQFQVGDDKNYMPTNQTKDLGNDDQAFWALSAMDAAEANFQTPSANQPSWLALAQAVFNIQITRWETSDCNGGLRWQIFYFNPGYDYKNTISTGGLFQLSARLARFTNNATYADWAERTWDWMYGTSIFGKKADGTPDGNIWDGVHIEDNCTNATQTYWTYNTGTLLSGAAYMYNYTNGSDVWNSRMQLLMNATDIFFVKTAGSNNPPVQPNAGGTILAEVACEFGTAPTRAQTCNYDEPSFKAYMLRWMAVAGKLVPWTHDLTMQRMRDSAAAAAVQCSGTGQGLQNQCGRRWYQNVWDGHTGVGEQMSALSVFQNLLIDKAAAPLSMRTGGTSKSDPAAGTQTTVTNPLINDPVYTRPITTGDKAGAGILTAAALILVMAGTYWMLV